jgi:hypothetical protein
MEKPRLNTKPPGSKSKTKPLSAMKKYEGNQVREEVTVVGALQKNVGFPRTMGGTVRSLTKAELREQARYFKAATANARLIASAPDLLIALKEAVDHKHVYDTNPALVELFEAVIAKAPGPWEISKIGNHYDQYSIYSGDTLVANSVEGEANARLIASAPETER